MWAPSVSPTASHKTREPVKKIVVALLWLSSAFASAANPNPAEYTVNIHVSASRMVTAHAPGFFQQLSVVIAGKRYELESESTVNALLAIGDYKAKLVKDEHREAYDSYQVYEFLFPDQKTRKFIVVGQTE